VGSLHPKDAKPVTTEAKSRDGIESSCHQTPAPLRRNIAEYITGFVDGEGCFTVTFNVREKAKKDIRCFLKNIKTSSFLKKFV
jgi:hypothetical protein